MSDYIKDIRKKIGHDAIFVPGVGAIIYKNGKVLLQKRADNKKWDIHGGAIELGETCLQALTRELKEEINVKPINPKLFGIYSGEKRYYEYTNGDKVYDILTVFFVEEYEGTLEKDNDEVIELKWFDLNDLPEDIDDMAILDIKKYLENKQLIID